MSGVKRTKENEAMHRSDFVKGLIIGLALIGSALVAQQTPSAQASGPRLSVGVADQTISITGTHFPTNGQRIQLYRRWYFGPRKRVGHPVQDRQGKPTEFDCVFSRRFNLPVQMGGNPCPIIVDVLVRASNLQGQVLARANVEGTCPIAQ
jgi:hypothetical protein